MDYEKYLFDQIDRLTIAIISEKVNSPTCYTATRLPVKLAYSAQFSSRIEALQAEKQIQGWSRKKKEALISGDWEKLSFLARRNKK